MKKLVITLLVVVMLLASTSVVFADSHKPDLEAVFEASPAWEDSGRGSLQNVNNNLLRFDWVNYRWAIPGAGGQYAGDYSPVLAPWDGEYSIVCAIGECP